MPWIQSVASGLRRAPGAVWAALGWLWMQTVGAWRNFWALLDYLTFDRILPPSIVSTIQFYIEAVPAALGMRGVARERMISAIITLALIVVLSTIVTFGLTIAALVALGVLLVIGLIRLFPAADRTWKRYTSDLVEEDYDLPRWRRD